MTWHRRSGELQRQIEDFNQEMDNQASLIGWENDEQDFRYILIPRTGRNFRQTRTLSLRDNGTQNSYNLNSNIETFKYHTWG